MRLLEGVQADHHVLSASHGCSESTEATLYQIGFSSTNRKRCDTRGTLRIQRQADLPSY